MSLKSFDNYMKVAQDQRANHTEVAGRYSFQAEAERHIIGDVASKLNLQGHDSLLEIGCGPGNLLIPLSFQVSSATGIDNSAALDRLAQRTGSNSTLHLLAGDFLSMPLTEQRYSKILIYSVIQYTRDLAHARQFLSRALSLLLPGGRLLLGDLPNTDKKQRFGASAAGKQTGAQWRQQVDNAEQHPLSSMPEDDQLLKVSDTVLLDLLAMARTSGFESHLLPQPASLPFGNTREDILFVAYQ